MNYTLYLWLNIVTCDAYDSDLYCRERTFLYNKFHIVSEDNYGYKHTGESKKTRNYCHGL